MGDSSTLLAQTDALEHAFGSRTTAWAAEAAAWGELEQTLATTDIIAPVRHIVAAVEHLAQLRVTLAHDVGMLASAGDALADGLEEVTHALRTIVHDTVGDAWQAAAAVMLRTGTAAADHLPQSEHVLVDAVAQTAVAALTEAEQKVSAAASAFHATMPDAVRRVAGAEAELRDKASKVNAVAQANLVASGVRVESDARSLSLSLLRQHGAQQVKVLQQLAQFGQQLQNGVRAVQDLGREVARLRFELGESAKGALQPIDEIRSILQTLHQRFSGIG